MSNFKFFLAKYCCMSKSILNCIYLLIHLTVIITPYGKPQAMHVHDQLNQQELDFFRTNQKNNRICFCRNSNSTIPIEFHFLFHHHLLHHHH